MAGSSFEHTTPEPTRRYEAPKPPEAGSIGAYAWRFDGLERAPEAGGAA
jgi:hypothetical protein